jgi:hypothetical protein
LRRKVTWETGKSARMFSMLMPLQLIGMTLVFCRLVYRSVIMPKLRRMAFRLLTFVTEGFKKITASSVSGTALGVPLNNGENLT